MSNEIDARIAELLLRGGMTYKQIGEEVGRSKSYVGNVKRRLGRVPARIQEWECLPDVQKIINAYYGVAA